MDTINWKNHTILIADDEGMNLEYIEEALLETGATIISACNGHEAVEKFKANPQVNVVLLDIRMPIMDGYGAMQAIRSSNSKIPIIAQTAFAFAEDKSKAIQMGFTDYLEKPLEQDVLISSINKYL